MRVLIIGGTAFMGPFVVKRLAAEGHTVAVFHRGKSKTDLPAGVTELLGDRRKIDDHAAELRAFRPEVVVDMMLLTESDAHGLLRTFKGVASRTVVASSIDAYKAYGILTEFESGPPIPGPISEDSPLREKHYPYRGRVPGLDDYDKVLAERAAQAEPTLPATLLRLPMVYGPGDRQHRLFEFLKRMDDKRPAILLDARTASWRGSRGYVENVAAAIARAATDAGASGRTYNVAEPEALSTRDWARKVGEAAGWRGRIVVAPPDQVPPHLRAEGMNPGQELAAESKRIRAELGWTEEVGFEEGLRRTVAWERAHPPEKFDPQAFDYAVEDQWIAKLKPEAAAR